ncbi:S1C family serine protease [Thiohalorhabdus sp. Cl-TMA]|uniref:Probable periplasmic serine endoprotease DegP-like n=1 Tax=Thiohalorhabdus methylotrophus TaxID=3242694 RepID=A0ABV4TVI3_9GAMM
MSSSPRGRNVPLPAMLALAGALIAAGCSESPHEASTERPGQEQRAPAVTQKALAGKSGIAWVAARNRPAVVNISTVRETAAAGKEGAGGPLERFFRRFFGQEAPRRKHETRSLGSGFIIDPAGYIVTNAHVIARADQVLVHFQDHRQLAAEVVGKDMITDIALLKVDASGLPAVRMAGNSRPQVGEWVVAMGSPFGFDSSVTAGIVSAKGRSLPGESGIYVPFLQTDVAINPGNSGGPLFNLQGAVVGVNAQIYSKSGGYMGLSFAIPSRVVQDVTTQLRETGEVRHGWLGVSIQTVNQRLAGSLGLQEPRGGVVARVVPEGPAAQAGLRTGDVILSVDGEAIDKASDIPPLVGGKQPGDELILTLLRDGERMERTVVLGSLEEARSAGNRSAAEPAAWRPGPGPRAA